MIYKVTNNSFGRSKFQLQNYHQYWCPSIHDPQFLPSSQPASLSNFIFSFCCCFLLLSSYLTFTSLNTLSSEVCPIVVQNKIFLLTWIYLLFLLRIKLSFPQVANSLTFLLLSWSILKPIFGHINSSILLTSLRSLSHLTSDKSILEFLILVFSAIFCNLCPFDVLVFTHMSAPSVFSKVLKTVPGTGPCKFILS